MSKARKSSKKQVLTGIELVLDELKKAHKRELRGLKTAHKRELTAKDGHIADLRAERDLLKKERGEWKKRADGA